MAKRTQSATERQPANPDIFIGYARENRKSARALAKFLETKGWSVWWDTKIRGGEMFATVINRALTKTSCVIILWSEDSTESIWVLSEAQEGLQRGILVPARLDETQRIPVPFKFLETVDLSSWDGSLPSSEEDPTHPGLSLVAEAVEAVLEAAESARESQRRPVDRVAQATGAPSEPGIEPKRIKRHRYVRVPDGSRVALKVSSDETRLEVSGGIDGGRARRKWKHEQLFNRTLRSVLRSPNRYEIQVQVTFKTRSKAQATVHAAIIKPDGSTHSKPWTSSPLSGKGGEIDFATISIDTLKAR